MKLKQRLTLFNSRFLLMFVLGLFSIQLTQALPPIKDDDEIKDIGMEGGWGGPDRSINPTLPITAFIQGDLLTILNAGQSCGMTIQVSNEQGTVVLSREVASSESGCITLSVDHLPAAGNYLLEISNSFGGYVFGSF